MVRLLARDDDRQVRSAEAFIAPGAWVSHLVLAETVWVLSAVYELGRDQVATALEMLLRRADLAVQDAETVAAALARYRRLGGVDFSDCLDLEIARKAGHLPLGTFDRKLAKLDGAERL